MSPFAKVQNLINAVTTDVINLFYAVAILGIVFCAFMIWRGSEENQPRFQKALVGTISAIILVALARVIVTWVKTKVA